MSDELKEKVTREEQIVARKGEHPKFIEQNVMMLSSNIMPYYAEFNTFINFYETTTIPTCGVNVSNKGMNFYWNRKFVDSLTDKESLFLLLHEDFHLLFDHTKRSFHYDKEISNIVQDMIINQTIRDELMNHEKTRGKIEIPKYKDEFILGEDGEPILRDGKKIKNPYFNKNSALFIPAEYKGEPIFEDLFEWFKEQQTDYRERKKQQQEQQQQQQEKGDQDQDNQGKESKEDQDGQGKGEQDQDGQGDGDQDQDGQGDGDNDSQNQGGNQSQNQGGGNGGNQQQDQDGQGDGSGEPTDSFGNPSYGQNGQNGVECTSMDSILDGLEEGKQQTLDTHIEDSVPEAAKKSIVQDFMDKLKNRGLVDGDIERILNKLRKSKHNYLKEIKRKVSSHIIGSSKKKSITRPNRRGIEGLKGKKKFKNVINVILDTSGSMGGDFERVLSFIFHNDIHINLIQIDTCVKAVENIKSPKELQQLTIKGMGGTVLQPAVEYIADDMNKLNKFNTVILTDGYTDTLDFTNIKGKVLILTTGCEPPHNDPKGLVKTVIIDRDNSIYG